MKVVQKEEEKISNEDISYLKTFFEEKELIEDNEMENLKKYYKEIGRNSIILAKLFLTSYDYLVTTMYSLNNEEITDRLRKYFLNFTEITYLRELLEDYGDGEDIGCYYIANKIKRYVIAQRPEMVHLINVFFSVFVEED